jgi:hypothetical protein
VTLKAFVAAPHTVSGTVTFSADGAQLDQPVAVTAGRAFLITSDLNVGTHTITAAYSGDAQTPAATSASPLDQVITGTVPLQIPVSSGSISHPLTISFTLQ